MNKQKLIDKLEIALDNYYDKNDSDKILTNYIKLLNCLNANNYRISIQQKILPISLILKRKEYSKKIELKFIDSQLYIDNIPIRIDEINEKI